MSDLDVVSEAEKAVVVGKVAAVFDPRTRWPDAARRLLETRL